MSKQRKFVRVLTLCVSTICAVILGLVTYVTQVVPNEMELSALDDYVGIVGLTFDRCDGAVSVSLPTASPRNLTLFGVIPVKTVYRTNFEEKRVTLGGIPFGCVLDLDGILVVGTSTVATANGLTDPAAEAGIRVGDMIQSCNGTALETIAQFSQLVENNRGEPVKLTYMRDGKTAETSIMPAYAEDE